MIKKMLLLVVGLLLLVAPHGISAEPQKGSETTLVLKPNITVHSIPLSALCAVIEGEDVKNIRVTTESGKLRFGGKRSLKLNALDTGEVVLPSFSTGKQEEESTINIKNDSFNCYLRVFVTKQEWFKYAIENLGDYGSALKNVGEGWFVIERPAQNTIPSEEETSQTDMSVSLMTSAAVTSSSSDAGTDQITFDREDGGGTLYPRAFCGRFYDITQQTRNAYGIVKWASNPASAGFSVKDENDRSGYVRNLRCPKGPYATEYLVDGVYKRSWQYFAYKVPNHCTATREVINGKNAFRCCCNLAMTTAGYGTCGYFDARTLPDWPDAGRSTCG
jgi:hypothetical protein